MRQTLYILTVSILLTSCATIMNQSHKNVTIYTTEPSKIILNRDTINTIDNMTIHGNQSLALSFAIKF